MSDMTLRIRVQKWAIVLLILFGVPALIIWLCMPYLDLSRASYLVSIHEYRAALKTLNRSIEFNGNLAAAYTRRGWVYDRLGQLEKAKEDFATALRLDPSSWEAFNNRAWLEYQKGDLENAMKDANQAVLHAPDCAYAYDTRGVVLMALSQSNEALVDFNKSLELNPTYGAALYHRGRCNDLLKNVDASSNDFRLAADLGYTHD